MWKKVSDTIWLTLVGIIVFSLFSAIPLILLFFASLGVFLILGAIVGTITLILFDEFKK